MKQPLTQKIYSKSALFLKRNSATILTCFGAVGVIGTSVVAVKATPKVLVLLDVAKKKKGEELTTLEMIQVAAPAYIPAAVIGAATISCIFGANVLNKRQQVALTSAYALIDQSYKEYQSKLKELYGDEADTKIKSEIAKDKFEDYDENSDGETFLFYEEYSGRYFEATMNAVKEAEYHFNRNFALRGYADLNELYEFLELEPTTYGATVGWSQFAGEITYGYKWIDFYHKRIQVSDDGLECYMIEMPFGPTADYMDY